MNENRQDEQGFTDLAEYRKVAPTGERIERGNVIKSHSVRLRGVEQIGVAMNEVKGQPSVHVHKEGDRVEWIEFLCSCGRNAKVRFEYEAE
jgi:hypothetical protein